MTKVFLRVYNHEIESMIEGGQLDEAVAHCQHILKTFPMHVDTYRLLGKAFLEARRYADAADIFQRVLMAVPDDFVSHVGMSIIRDDENKMDDAIWHMERAFEVQPSNSAIQGELRRLYGRRDGVEPSKIRLSRDALANMYSQGELFNQAIAEIRSVLAEDSSRPDLQVMLARAYYRSGQKVEAAEMAAELLKKYPYCMDSLRILVDVLPGTARAENTQVYRQRLHNLDPYSSFTVNSVFSSDQVGDPAVNLERLEYKSGSTPVTSQPDWASSLGIKLNDEKQADTPPAWMQSADANQQATASTPEPSVSSIAPTAAEGPESVPEWMRSAGWQESNNPEQVVSADSGESLPDEPIAKADIPDWLKSMAPTETTEVANAESDEPVENLPVGEDGIPEWLKPTGSLAGIGAAISEIKAMPGTQAESQDSSPDGPKSLSPAEAVGDEHIEPALPSIEPPQIPIEPQTASEGNVPDWLKSMAPVGPVDEAQIESAALPAEPTPALTELQSASEDEVPDWLKSMGAADAVDESHQESPVPPAEPTLVPAVPQPASVDEVPDLLKSMTPAEPVDEAQVEPVAPSPATVEPQHVSEDDVPEWLKSLSPTEPVNEVDEPPVLPIEPPQAQAEPQSEGSNDFPDWFKSLGAAEAAEQVQTEPQQPITSQPLPAESRPASEAEVPDWLKSLGSAEPAGEAQPVDQQPIEPQQSLVESRAGTADDVLDWLKSMDSAETDGEATSQPTQQPVEPVQAPVEPSPVSKGGVPDWFKSLTSVQPNIEEVAVEVPQTSAEPPTVGMDAIPDWLKPLSPAESSAEIPAEAPQTPAASPIESEEGIPDWLKSMPPAETVGVPEAASEPAPAELTPVMAEPDAVPEGAPPEKAETFPDWLTGMGARADAAALSAKPMEQPVVNEPSTPGIPVPPEPTVQALEKPATSPAGASGESFKPTGAVKPLSIGDDAFSWLESLAAKQGARPEELLTNPEERSGEMPAWLRQPDEKPSETPAAPAQEQKRIPPETLPLEPLSLMNQAPVPTPVQPVEKVVPSMDEVPLIAQPTEIEAKPEIQPVSGEDDTMAWLETLGTDQEPKSEETIPAPPELASAEEDISITSWLSKKEVDETLGKKASDIPVESAPPTPMDDLPDWLRDLEKPAASAETPKADNDLPEWLRHPIPSEPSSPTTPAPVLDATGQPALPAWMDENASATGQAAPTSPEEWLPAETKAEDFPDFLPPAEPSPVSGIAPQAYPVGTESIPGFGSTPVSEPVPVNEIKPMVETPPVVGTSQPDESIPVSVPRTVRMPTLKQTGMLSHIPVLDKDAELLLSAQNILDQDSLDDAMKKYTKLVKKGRLLDEVIHDLREAIYRYPVDVIVWQTLGDAYMRANRLQDALDAYTKAEELLR